MINFTETFMHYGDGDVLPFHIQFAACVGQLHLLGVAQHRVEYDVFNKMRIQHLRDAGMDEPQIMHRLTPATMHERRDHFHSVADAIRKILTNDGVLPHFDPKRGAVSIKSPRVIAEILSDRFENPFITESHVRYAQDAIAPPKQSKVA